MKTDVRWMIRRDMNDVLRIENESFEFPWSEDEFVRCLKLRNNIGIVAVADARIVGYAIYELHSNRFHVLNLAVAPEHRRQGVGSRLVGKLISKLTAQRRSRILMEVRETNLTAQLFLRKLEFRAVSVLREFYSQTDEDAYVMQYRHNATIPVAAGRTT